MLIVVLVKMLVLWGKGTAVLWAAAEVFYSPDASLERNIGVLTCLTVTANACIRFLMGFFSIIDAAEWKSWGFTRRSWRTLKGAYRYPRDLLTNCHEEKSLIQKLGYF